MAATQEAEPTSTYAWDVNRRNAGFWDPHMTIQALQWLGNQPAYDSESIRLAMKKLLSKTLLADFYPMLTGEAAPDAEVARAAEMKQTFVNIERRLEGFLSCMIAAGRERQESGTGVERRTIKEWQEYWRAHTVQQQSGNDADGNCTKPVEFPEDALKLLLQYCQLYFAFGDYRLCKRWLLFYLDHVCEFTLEGRDNVELRLKCLWGLVASMILNLPTPEDIEAMGEHPLEGDDSYLIPKHILIIDDLLESSKLPREQIVLSRLWLFHWFYFLKLHPAGSAGTVSVGLVRSQHIPFHIEWTRLIDWMLSDQTLSLVAAMCPQLLRYVAVLAILNKQRQDHFKAAVDVISRASFRYSDLLTTMLDSLFVKYNFDEAQDKLAQCKEEAAADFLLAPLKDAIEEHARLLIFQTYCRIQKSIDIDMIARKLHMTADTAERWIVNLIRHARLEAKIDSERNCVEIASPSSSVYQQVLEKTRNILVRTSVLIQSLDRPAGTSTALPQPQRGEFFLKQRGGPGGGLGMGGNLRADPVMRVLGER